MSVFAAFFDVDHNLNIVVFDDNATFDDRLSTKVNIESPMIRRPAAAFLDDQVAVYHSAFVKSDITVMGLDVFGDCHAAAVTLPRKDE